MHVETKHGTLNFKPGLKNARPALDMRQPRWLTPWDGAYLFRMSHKTVALLAQDANKLRCGCTHTGHTSRIVRTMRQQDAMRGGGGSSRRTELTIEQNVTAAVLLLMPRANPSTASRLGEG